MADQEKLQGIGGWLLVLIIWLAISMIASLCYNIYEIMLSQNAEGLISKISFVSRLFYVGWYGFFIWKLINFTKMRPGSKLPIDIFLLLNPILDLIMPFACLFIFACFTSFQIFPGTLYQVYMNNGLLGYITGFIISYGWYFYLKKSRRVQNTYSN